MLKISLNPLDSRLAETLARARGLTVPALISNLLRDEAAIELVAGGKATEAAQPLKAQPEGGSDACQA